MGVLFVARLVASVTEAVTVRMSVRATGLSQPNWSCGTVFGPVTAYFAPTGWASTQGETTEANVPFRMDQGGTIRRLAVLVEDITAGTSLALTFRKNGVDQPLTVTCVPGDTYKADGTHSFTVAAGDTVIHPG